MAELKEPEIIEEQSEIVLDDQAILNRLRYLRIVNIWAVRIFFTVLFAVAIIALIIPLRPKFSETEKRELEKFPEFSIISLFSGEYFIGIDNWYSDTFPARDFFSEMNTTVSNLFGFNKMQIHGEVEQGDDIPSVTETVSQEETSSNETVSSEEESVQEVVSEETTPEPQPEPAPQPETPPAPTTQTLGALFINGDTAYEYYNFNQAASDKYANAVKRAAALLSGTAKVYDIIVPTSMGISVPDDLVSGLNTSNQKDAINYMYSCMGSDVIKVPIFDELKARKDEYIYFRTDHHWTSLGAYYAYCEFAKAKGITASSLDSFTKYEFPGFLGTFYSSSGKLAQLAANPDTVYAYQPVETNSLQIYSPKAVWYDSFIISDMSSVSSGSKYLTFIRGDNPLCAMTNPNLDDGSCCVVIKESFGNAFVPYLVSHYQTVYVLDYRHFPSVDSRGLLEFCQDAGADDVIFINNISATRSSALVNAIDSLVR